MPNKGSPHFTGLGRSRTFFEADAAQNQLRNQPRRSTVRRLYRIDYLKGNSQHANRRALSENSVTRHRASRSQASFGAPRHRCELSENAMGQSAVLTVASTPIVGRLARQISEKGDCTSNRAFLKCIVPVFTSTKRRLVKLPHPAVLVFAGNRPASPIEHLKGYRLRKREL